MVERSAPLARIVTVLMLPASTALIFHLSLAFVIERGVGERWWLLAFMVVFFCATFALAGVAAAVLRERWVPYALAGLVAVSAVAVGFSIPVLIGIMLEVIAIGSFARNARLEASGRITFSIWKSLSFGITTSITLGLLATSLYSYDGFTRPGVIDKLRSTFSDASVNTLNATLPFIYPEYRPEMTVDEFIQRQLPTGEDILRGSQGVQGSVSHAELEQLLERSGIDPKQAPIQQLLSSQKIDYELLARSIDEQLSALSEELLSASRLQLSTTLGVELQGNEKVSDVLRTIVGERYQRFTAPNIQYIPFILAGSLFFTLALFTPVYMWLSWLIGGVSFWLMKVSTTVVLEEEAITVKRFRIR